MASVTPNQVLQLHWLGKKRLTAATNAINFMALWNLPESVRLETQALDKLSTAPWRLWHTNTPLSHAPVAELRQLLVDLIQEESYVEAVTNAGFPLETVIALRLPPERAEAWKTNLSGVFKSLASDASGSAAKDSAASLGFQYEKVSDWTLVFVSPQAKSGNATSVGASPSSGLLDRIRRRVIASGVPFIPSHTNYLLKCDFAKGLPLLDQLVPLSIKGLSLLAFSDGQNVRVRGGVTFAEAVNLPLEAWNVPSNQIYQPLSSFSALRGFKPYLEQSGVWREKNLGSAPNQLFFWGQGSAPWLHFFTVPSPNSTNHFLALKNFVLDWLNPELAPNRTGAFGWETNDWRVVWKGVPFCSPAIQLKNDWISGGFVAKPITGGKPLPEEIVAKVVSEPNLVYYHWEATGIQVNSFVQIGQLMRMAFSRAQLAVTNAGLPWLQVINTNLSYSATSITLTDSNHLSFARSATLGLTALELHLFADWVDSPDFPLGLYTFNAPRDFIMNRTRPRP